MDTEFHFVVKITNLQICFPNFRISSISLWNY